MCSLKIDLLGKLKIHQIKLSIHYCEKHNHWHCTIQRNETGQYIADEVAVRKAKETWKYFQSALHSIWWMVWNIFSRFPICSSWQYLTRVSNSWLQSMVGIQANDKPVENQQRQFQHIFQHIIWRMNFNLFEQTQWGNQSASNAPDVIADIMCLMAKYERNGENEKNKCIEFEVENYRSNEVSNLPIESINQSAN